ncbi:uncharacterized protein LOC117342640 [Pecten maximus]|uniref:uncharacterized protein LOC117342640 n=1 Tax=Pecten maximus TaxID=6579 RepID=UPI001458A1EA|nr:uncharacterized protein LOC117342640 [Pecten maximus]
MEFESYKSNISTIIAGGFVTSALTIGRKLGLFDTLTKLTTPVTSQHLADLCYLKERYVREWLGCMVASNIVSLDDDDNYFIPEHCKPVLGDMNILCIYPLVNAMTKRAMECFRKEGPDGYGFEDMPTEMVDAQDGRLGEVNGLVNAILEPVLAMRESSVLNILDIGSGAGVFTRVLGKRFPGAAVFGVDVNELAIKKAITKPGSPSNVTYLQASVSCLPSNWTNKFDLVLIYGVLHDLSCPSECMCEVSRVLKYDGVVSIADPHVHSNHKDNSGDFSHAGMAYAISSVICLPSSMSTEGAAGNGIGWGIENREAFLSEAGCGRIVSSPGIHKIPADRSQRVCPGANRDPVDRSHRVCPGTDWDPVDRHIKSVQELTGTQWTDHIESVQELTGTQWTDHIESVEAHTGGGIIRSIPSLFRNLQPPSGQITSSVSKNIELEVP